MTDEEEAAKKKAEEEAAKTEDKPISIVDEAKAIRDEIVKARDELKAENDRKGKLQADEMLSGTGGGHLKTQKVETNKEYNERIEKEISEGKHED